MTTNHYKSNVTGVILAGGKARRMDGHDKGLIKINDKAMVSYVINMLKPQVSDILINANRNKEAYEKFGYSVINDKLNDFQGPLAGMATAMQAVSTPYICTCPCDGPFIAKDLVKRLYTELLSNHSEIAVAHDGKRIQPVFALFSCSLLTSLNNYLANGERKIDHWYMQHNLTEVDFSDQPNCFLNINTPEEKIEVSKLLPN